MSDDQLRAYITRILELKASRQEDLSSEELGAIALELGLSEADLAAGKQAAEAHLERGLGYCRHQRWADAVPELEQAMVLLPGRLEAIEALAQAHAGCWRQTGENADKQAAIRLARRCLTLNPKHEAAFRLLNQLDPPANARRPARLGAIVVVGCILLIGVAVVGVRQGPRHRQATAPVPTSTPVPATAEPRSDDRELDLPVTLAAQKASGIVLHPRHSRLKRYPDSAFYELGALLENTGKAEWSKVQLKAELIGARQQVLRAEYVEALGTHMAPVRPGDRHAFSHLFRTKPEMTALRLTVTLRDEVPIRTLQSVSRPVDLGWTAQKPDGAALSVRERSAAVSRNTFFKPESIYFKPVFEVRNDGQTTIRRLQLELSAFDPRGGLLKSNYKHVVYGEGLELPPGETRVVNYIENLPPRYHHYKLSVLEIE